MEANRTGDMSELKAVVWLWEQGYEVFRNMGCTGSIDLIAVKDKEVLKIDVKTVRTTGRGYCFRVKDHEKILAKGIIFLWVYKEEVGWNRDYFTFD